MDKDILPKINHRIKYLVHDFSTISTDQWEGQLDDDNYIFICWKSGKLGYGIGSTEAEAEDNYFNSKKYEYLLRYQNDEDENFTYDVLLDLGLVFIDKNMDVQALIFQKETTEDGDENWEYVRITLLTKDNNYLQQPYLVTCLLDAIDLASKEKLPIYTY
jgi:hypothetical protein